jgi:hypothetical protein
MGDDHRLGVIEFRGAEDGSSTISVGARIQAICRDAWDGSNNDADLEFYTTDGTTESKVLTLDADKKATFNGNLTVNAGIIQDGNQSVTPGDGAALHIDTSDITDSNTSASGTAVAYRHVSIENPRLLATNASVTTTDAATLYVKGAPAASTNQTISNAWSLWVDAGDARFDANVEAASLTVGGTNVLTGSLITTLGTISSGVWQGTAIATDQQKHLAYFEFKGYGSSDGTNYEMPEIISDNNAPFEHNTSTGSDGLTAQAVTVVMRQGGIVMPHTGVLKKFTGWVTTQGTGTVDVGIFKFTPVDNNADPVTPVLLVNEQIDGAGNTKMRSFSETSSFDAGFTAGDIIYSAVLGSGSGKSWYLNSMLEVEWS